MHTFGVLLIVVAGVIWLGGGRLVVASRRRRLGQPSHVFGLSPLRIKQFNTRERLWLLALLLAFVVLVLVGLAMV